MINYNGEKKGDNFFLFRYWAIIISSSSSSSFDNDDDDNRIKKIFLPIQKRIGDKLPNEKEKENVK